jgi:hypothetical protein
MFRNRRELSSASWNRLSADKHLNTKRQREEFIFCANAIFFTRALLTRSGGWRRQYRHRLKAYPRRENPMRDSMFMLAPVALVIYFLIYPDQFNALLAWAGQYLR